MELMHRKSIVMCNFQGGNFIRRLLMLLGNGVYGMRKNKQGGMSPFWCDRHLFVLVVRWVPKPEPGA